MPRQLRAVAKGERAPRRPAVRTVSQAATNGTTRDLLVAMRARIAKSVEDPNTSPRDLAPLSKRLVEIVRDIEAIDARLKADEAEEAAAVEDGTFDASAV